ncbi:MAG: diaminopimelate epimerase [Myxococcales bacterium]|nr:diaminopimelate epimerase [Myxococcales bacterium]
MRFLKAHGLGNDYLVLEEGGPITPSLCRAICDRHTGLGSDGILEPADPGGCDHGVTIWNPDGSVAEKSGNGLRIYARWLHDARGAPAHFTVWTGACAVQAEVHAEDVTVAMGRARVGETTLAVDGAARPLVIVDLGNPHCVWFTDSPLDALPWRSWGATLENHPHFPNRTNVQFVRIVHGAPEIRIWERGAGETSASGSSSCAVVAASVATGRLAPGAHTVHMPGGTLAVAVDDGLEVTLRGPVEVVGRMTLDPGWLSARG